MATSTSGRHIAAVAIVVVVIIQVVDAFSSIPLNNRRCDSLCDRCMMSNSSTDGDIKLRTRDEVERIRRLRRRNLEYWGVENLPSRSQFPSTFDEVADDVFHAIAGTISGTQRPDPNIASNAMHKSVLDYRPTHPFASSKRRWSNNKDDEDAPVTKADVVHPARMGVEIDGALYLSEGLINEGQAIRKLSLQIAKRLSILSWDMTERNTGQQRPARSVAIYYNSVEQCLLASRELSVLITTDKENNTAHQDYWYDNIQINCLGQDPLPLRMAKEKGKERLILVVKPTDYDEDESRYQQQQPRIQANVVDKLQSLLFQASAASIPAVVLSPRLSELPPLQQATQMYKRTGPSGFEQSGFQKSSTYGGIEPPVGPTSWLLRDLVPPIYVWVGCANALFQRKGTPQLSMRSVAALFREHEHDGSSRSRNDSGTTTYTLYTRIALVQSAMDAGHSWHMFAVKEHFSKSFVKKTTHYIGSSIASRGRPSSRIMNDVFEEYCEHTSTAKV
jgi:hypothetical protein